MERYGIRCPRKHLMTDLRVVYAEYAKTANLLAVLIYGIMLVGAQIAQIGKLRLQTSSRVRELLSFSHA